MDLHTLRRKISILEYQRENSIKSREKRRKTKQITILKKNCREIQENIIMKNFITFIDTFRHMGLDVKWRREFDGKRSFFVFEYKGQTTKVKIHIANTNAVSYRVRHYINDVVASCYETVRIQHICINLHSVSLFHGILDDLN